MAEALAAPCSVFSKECAAARRRVWSVQRPGSRTRLPAWGAPLWLVRPNSFCSGWAWRWTCEGAHAPVGHQLATLHPRACAVVIFRDGQSQRHRASESFR
eukprot:68341-Chlamydomonas_euryale.AAC.4